MAIALRYLDLSEMVALTGAWLEQHGAVLASIPEVEPLVGRIRRAHEAALAARPAAPTDGDERVADLSAKARAVDARHDHAVRALYHALTAASEYVLAQETADEKLALALQQLRDRLLPEGLASTQATFHAEAGNVARAAHEVAHDPAAPKLLHRVHVLAKVTGVELMEEWSALGEELGRLEQAKAVEAGRVSNVAPAGGSKGVVQARNGWIQIVATVLDVLEHSDAPAVAIGTIRDPVVQAAQRAAARNAARQTPAAPASDEAPAHAAPDAPAVTGKYVKA